MENEVLSKHRKALIGPPELALKEQMPADIALDAD